MNNTPITYYVKINENRKITDFSVNQIDGYFQIALPAEWKEYFGYAFERFTLDENKAVVAPKDGTTATWIKFNELSPDVQNLLKQNADLKTENDQLKIITGNFMQQISSANSDIDSLKKLNAQQMLAISKLIGGNK